MTFKLVFLLITIEGSHDDDTLHAVACAICVGVKCCDATEPFLSIFINYLASSYLTHLDISMIQPFILGFRTDISM